MKANIFKRLFTWKLLLISSIYLIILIIIFCAFGNSPIVNLILAIGSSIFASFIIGAFFQFSIQDEISKEHLEIIKFLNEKNESGLVKYYPSFKDCLEDMKEKIVRARSVVIYVVEGNSIFNALSDELKLFISKKGNELEVILLDPENKFIEGLAQHWGMNDKDYDKDGITEKIKRSKDLFKEKLRLAKDEDRLKANVNLYKNKFSPVNYSFYIIDDFVFFVPSKIVVSKEYVPVTFLAAKNQNKGSLYNKVLAEYERSVKDKIFEQIDLELE